MDEIIQSFLNHGYTVSFEPYEQYQSRGRTTCTITFKDADGNPRRMAQETGGDIVQALNLAIVSIAESWTKVRLGNN